MIPRGSAAPGRDRRSERAFPPEEPVELCLALGPRPLDRLLESRIVRRLPDGRARGADGAACRDGTRARGLSVGKLARPHRCRAGASRVLPRRRSGGPGVRTERDGRRQCGLALAGIRARTRRCSSPNHTYAACRKTVEYVARPQTGARVVVARPALSVPRRGGSAAAVLGAVSPRTRLALLDHVTSPDRAHLARETRLIAALDARGIDTLVDGAHAPGMVPLSAVGARRRLLHRQRAQVAVRTEGRRLPARAPRSAGRPASDCDQPRLHVGFPRRVRLDRHVRSDSVAVHTRGIALHGQRAARRLAGRSCRSIDALVIEARDALAPHPRDRGALSRGHDRIDGIDRRCRAPPPDRRRTGSTPKACTTGSASAASRRGCIRTPCRCCGFPRSSTTDQISTAAARQAASRTRCMADERGLEPIEARLSAFDSSMVVFSLVMGIGIFRTPAIVAGAAGDSLLFYAAWIAGGLVSLDRRAHLRRDRIALSARRGLLPGGGGLLSPDIRLHAELVADADAGRGGRGRRVHRRGLSHARHCCRSNWRTPNASLATGLRHDAGAARAQLPRHQAGRAHAKCAVRAQDRHDLRAGRRGPAARAPSSPRRDPPRPGLRGLRLASALIPCFYAYGGYQLTMNLGADLKDARRRFPLAIDGRHAQRGRTVPAAQRCISTRARDRRHRALEAGGGGTVARDLRPAAKC